MSSWGAGPPHQPPDPTPVRSLSCRPSGSYLLSPVGPVHATRGPTRVSRHRCTALRAGGASTPPPHHSPSHSDPPLGAPTRSSVIPCCSQVAPGLPPPASSSLNLNRAWPYNSQHFLIQHQWEQYPGAPSGHLFLRSRPRSAVGSPAASAPRPPGLLSSDSLRLARALTSRGPRLVPRLLPARPSHDGPVSAPRIHLVLVRRSVELFYMSAILAGAWPLPREGYNFKMQHVPGSKNIVADGLLRLPIKHAMGTEEDKLEEVALTIKLAVLNKEECDKTNDYLA
ncbi:hypothetical protein NDU88_005731 [Pleurodeles waltl]|uniref:Uncharacterized protein n=1 Tax=Pleurodeles waltl TaxID=8319 RepID=A0AAV7SML4_PLEWA|nr:hypothetical protein NDU88_005731 [Pleurodeles waltl]